MKYKKGLVVALLFMLLVATVGLSGCGKDEEKLPTLNEVKTVMENHGFVETAVDPDFTGPELLETIRYKYGDAITYSLSIYKEQSATKDLMDTFKENKESYLLKKFGENSKVEQTVLKDDKDDEFQFYAKRWGNDAYILVRNKNTFVVIDITANNDKEFAECVKRINDVRADLGIKGEL